MCRLFVELGLSILSDSKVFHKILYLFFNNSFLTFKSLFYIFIINWYEAIANICYEEKHLAKLTSLVVLVIEFLRFFLPILAYLDYFFFLLVNVNFNSVEIHFFEKNLQLIAIGFHKVNALRLSDILVIEHLSIFIFFIHGC